MAPVRILERNIRPRKRTHEESASDVDHSDWDNKTYNDDDGKGVQAPRDTRNLKLCRQQDAKSDGGRGMGDSEPQVEGMVDDGDDGSRSGGDEVSEDDEQQRRGLDAISFGALKSAHERLTGGPRGRSVLERRRRAHEGDEADLENLRKRMKDARQGSASKSSSTIPSWRPASTTAESDGKIADSTSNSDSDSDSAPSEEGAPTSRSSKHAPAAQSSKYQVTRKRQVIDVPKRVARDPRFDAFNGSSSSAHPSTAGGNVDKAYSFLQDYQKSEIVELKAAIRKTKSDDDKEKLKRTLMAMENRLKAKEAKEREREVVRRHRKEEKGQIEQGKNPYYLKKSELKERALVEKFKGMKGKDREKVLEKRKKKEGQKEKKRMPALRRVTHG